MQKYVMRRLMAPFRWPLLWGILYILAIPAFALKYARMPHDFYHSTAHLEPSLEHDETEILNALRETIIRNFVEVHGRRNIWEHDPQWQVDEVKLFNLAVDRSDVSFDLDATPGPPSRHMPTHLFRVRFGMYWARRGADTSTRMYGIMPEAEHGDYHRLMATLFPVNPRYSDEMQTDNVGFIIVSDALERKLDAWGDGMRGFPGESTGANERFFYLSAMTLTTVGYGDVVPLTARARGWVTAEAISGVVLVGLFLNALALRLGPASQP